MYRLPFALLLVSSLLACPAPGEDGPSNQQAATTHGGEGAPGAGGEHHDGPPPEGPADPGAPEAPPEGDGDQGPLRGHIENFGGDGGPRDAEGEGDLHLVQPVNTQESVEGSPHFTLSGEVNGACQGLVRVDVLSTRPRTGVPGEDGPVTAVELDGARSFSVKVPLGEEVELSALCDGDRDGVIRGGGGDSVSAPNPTTYTQDADGVELSLEALESVLAPTFGGREAE